MLGPTVPQQARRRARIAALGPTVPQQARRCRRRARIALLGPTVTQHARRRARIALLGSTVTQHARRRAVRTAQWSGRRWSTAGKRFRPDVGLGQSVRRGCGGGLAESGYATTARGRAVAPLLMYGWRRLAAAASQRFGLGTGPRKKKGSAERRVESGFWKVLSARGRIFEDAEKK